MRRIAGNPWWSAAFFIEEPISMSEIQKQLVRLAVAIHAELEAPPL